MMLIFTPFQLTAQFLACLLYTSSPAVPRNELRPASLSVKRLGRGKGGAWEGKGEPFWRKVPLSLPHMSLERHVVHAAGRGRKRRAQIFVIVLPLLRALLGTAAASLLSRRRTAGSAVAALDVYKRQPYGFSLLHHLHMGNMAYYSHHIL